MAKITLIYRRGDGNFRKGFSHFMNNVSKDLNTVPGLDTLIWWFKALDGTKKSITWTGFGDVDGVNNEQFYFDIPANFFDVVTNYDCDIEPYDAAGTLIYHTLESFLVQVTEPAGVHSDT